MGGDEVGVDGEPEYPETFVEVVLPDRCIPFSRAALEHFSAPDVVDQHIDVPVVPVNPLGQFLDLGGIEMIDCGRNAGAAEIRDELGRVFDGLGAVVVGPG